MCSSSESLPKVKSCVIMILKSILLVGKCCSACSVVIMFEVEVQVLILLMAENIRTF